MQYCLLITASQSEIKDYLKKHFYLYQRHEVFGLTQVQLLLYRQKKHTACPQGKLSWCGMSWDRGGSRLWIHSSSEAHWLKK